MSRPQYDYYQAPMQMRAQVVNGGLIDFQDNSLQRGAQDYVTPNQYMAASVYPPQGFPQIASQFQQPQNFMASQAGPGGQSYISGPPSFLHMNGVTYKPVEDANTVAAKPCEPAPDEVVKTLSEGEFHQAISEHVQRKVDSYMTKQSSHNSRHAKTVSAKNIAKRGHVDEEQAAMRVKAVNASMRGQTGPAPWQSCASKW
jgi:hypothetical protein